MGIFTTRGKGPLQAKSSKVTTTLLVMAACVFAATTGYDSALMNGINIIPSYKATLHLTPATKSLNTASISVGSAIASFFMGPVLNKIGRKSGIVVSVFAKLIGIILMTGAQNVPMFVIGRMCLGFGNGCSGTAAPVWLAETLPFSMRGSGLSFIFTIWYFGALIAAGVTYGTGSMSGTWAWRLPCALQSIFSFACMAILFFVPESPRWLAYQGRRDEALTVVASVHSNGDVTDPVTVAQYQEIIDTLEYERNAGEKLTYLQIVKTPNSRRRLMLAISCGMIGMLSGNSIVSFYLGDMLSKAGITSSHTQLEINIILNAWCLCMACCGTYLVDRAGRKAMALTACILMTICLFMVGALTKVYGHGGNTSGIYGTVASIFLFQGSYSLGITPITVLYPPEVLNYSIRSNGMAAWTLAVDCFGLFTNFVFPIALAAISYKLYFINGSWDALQALFVFFFWVETKGKTLEEIDELLDGRKHSEVLDLETVLHDKGDVLDSVETEYAKHNEVVDVKTVAQEKVDALDGEEKKHA